MQRPMASCDRSGALKRRAPDRPWLHLTLAIAALIALGCGEGWAQSPHASGPATFEQPRQRAASPPPAERIPSRRTPARSIPDLLAGDHAESKAQVRALIVPRQRALIAAGMAGTVLHIGPENGERFKKGATLVRFDCAIHRAELNRADANARAAVVSARIKRTLAASRSISRLQATLAISEQKKAEAEVDVAQAKVRLCTIQAPFAGRVVTRRANAYETVSPRDPLIEIVNDRDIEVRAFAPSLWLRWLRVGQRFTVRLDETGRRFDARIIAIGATIDNVSQLIEVRARLLGEPRFMLAGMSGLADFEQHIAVPSRNVGAPALSPRGATGTGHGRNMRSDGYGDTRAPDRMRPRAGSRPPAARVERGRALCRWRRAVTVPVPRRCVR
ncbi:MAG: efflux RND transporter periplasmic adaptor subunit, partial [Pseudomonadota bacterium]